MTMPSNTALDGTKSTTPGSILTIHWTDDMLFNGRDAEFSGGVVALQNDSTMQCQNLQVELDKPISFKAEPQKGDKRDKGDKEDKGAKVQSVIAHGKVCVLDEVKDKDDKTKFTQKSRLECHELKMDNPPSTEANPTSVVIAYGPGAATVLSYGAPEGVGTNNSPSNVPAKGKAQSPAKSTAKPEQLMRTKIDFQERMFSTQQSDKTRKSTFMGNVVLVHAPGDSLDAAVDVTDPRKLAKGGVILYCTKLTVDERQRIDPATKQSTTVQTMTAETKVRCMTNDMVANAVTAVFDKATDMIIFKGDRDNPAQLSKTDGPPGSPPQQFSGQTILYNQKTGLATVDRSSGISGELAPSERLQPVPEYLLARR
jgi:hypothetical protein